MYLTIIIYFLITMIRCIRMPFRCSNPTKYVIFLSSPRLQTKKRGENNVSNCFRRARANLLNFRRSISQCASQRACCQ